MSRKAKPREWCGTHAHRLTAELRSAAYGYKTDTLTHYTDCGLFCMFLQFSPFAFFSTRERTANSRLQAVFLNLLPDYGYFGI